MDIASSTSRLIATVAKLHRARAEALLTTIGLHAGQEFVLSALWEKDGLTQIELARALAVAPPTINRMVARMEEAGLVRRRAAARDPRLSEVVLTEEGRGIRGAAEQIWSTLEAQTLGPLSAKDRAKLSDLLTKIAAGLEKVVSTDS